MAKGKRSNSPKRSRRGGRRSPKKSNKGVHKMISKDVPELPARAIMAELEAEADSAKLIVTLCGHAYCVGCLEGWKDTPGTPSCPLCRKPIAAGRHGSRYMTVGDLRKTASWATKRKRSQMKL